MAMSISSLWLGKTTLDIVVHFSVRTAFTALWDIECK